MSDTSTLPSDVPSGASQARERAKNMDGAESNPRAATDKLKAQGDAMAKKHGG